MQITISQKILAEALVDLTPLAAKKKALIVFNNIKFVTKGNKVRLQTSDGDTTIRKYVEAEDIDQDGEFLVDCASIAALTAKIKDDTLTLLVDDGILTVKYANGKATFPILPVEDFVEPTTSDEVVENVISTQALAKFVSNARNFVSSDDFNVTMRPIRAIVKNGELTVCATDTRRMFVDTVQAAPDAQDTEWFIEQSAFAPLLSACKGGDIAVVRVSNKNVSYRIGATTIFTQQTQGRFPDFTRALPKEHTIDVVCKKSDIASAIQRASLFVEKGVDLLKIAVSQTSLNVYADNIGKLQKVVETLACTANAEIEFGASAPIFLDCLNACDSNEVAIELNDAKRPIVIKDNSNAKRIVLFMPMILAVR